MSRCDECLRHVDMDLECVHAEHAGRGRLCSDCCGCDPDRGPAETITPDLHIAPDGTLTPLGGTR